MKISAHCLVKNEERYLWFAVKSVIDHVDKILLWDTGSTDNTVKIIKLLQKEYPEKIQFKEVGDVDPESFTKVRQQMLEDSICDWIMILDGDEVWWEKSIKNAREIIEKKGKTLDSLVHHYYNIVGDIYHYQDPCASKYKIDGKIGDHTIRFFNRNISGIQFDKPHGTQGLYDGAGVLIQERAKTKRLHTNDYYMHFTHMVRSESRVGDRDVIKRAKKLKYELGIPFPPDFRFPEVFLLKYPSIVRTPFERRTLIYLFKATVQAPIKKFKRKFLNNEKIGY